MEKTVESIPRLSLIPIPALNERHRIRCENGTVVVQSPSFSLSLSPVGKHPPVRRVADVRGKKLTEFPEIYKRATRLGVARRSVNSDNLALQILN